MRKKHKKTFDSIYHKPTLASISWKDIKALFVALGAEIIEGRGFRISVVLNGQVAVFHRPHSQKEAVKGAVVSVREFLRLTGEDKC